MLNTYYYKNQLKDSSSSTVVAILAQKDMRLGPVPCVHRMYG